MNQYEKDEIHLKRKRDAISSIVYSHLLVDPGFLPVLTQVTTTGINDAFKKAKRQASEYETALNIIHRSRSSGLKSKEYRFGLGIIKKWYDAGLSFIDWKFPDDIESAETNPAYKWGD